MKRSKEHQKQIKRRTTCALYALKQYKFKKEKQPLNPEDLNEEIIDLVADLLHLAEENRLSVHDIKQTATCHLEFEQKYVI